MNTLTTANDLITKARVILFDVIKEQMKGHKISFIEDSPSLIVEDDDGVHILNVKSVDADTVYFEDGTDIDLGDLETDQLAKLAQEISS